MILKPEWLPRVPMKGIIVHWTAGSYTPNNIDKKAYHFLIDGNAEVIKGIPGIELNSGRLKPGYSAHTLNCNTNFISVSIACMGGAIESPFNPGRWPMKESQFEHLAHVLAVLCRTYSIPVTPQTVMSHAEVQANLGITQRAKWDYTRVPWDLRIRSARAIGDILRNKVKTILGYKKESEIMVPIPTTNPIPTGGSARVRTNGSNLTIRRDPSLSGSLIGSGLPNGLEIEVIEPTRDGKWVRVRTKTQTATEGWVSTDFIEMIDGPAAEEPTTPNPLRKHISQLRKLADDLEKVLDNA